MSLIALEFLFPRLESTVDAHSLTYQVDLDASKSDGIFKGVILRQRLVVMRDLSPLHPMRAAGVFRLDRGDIRPFKPTEKVEGRACQAKVSIQLVSAHTVYQYLKQTL